ncbi:unnamed protein product, partial [Bubo scandiacus]
GSAVVGGYRICVLWTCSVYKKGPPCRRDPETLRLQFGPGLLLNVTISFAWVESG